MSQFIMCELCRQVDSDKTPAPQKTRRDQAALLDVVHSLSGYLARLESGLLRCASCAGQVDGSQEPAPQDAGADHAALLRHLDTPHGLPRQQLLHRPASGHPRQSGANAHPHTLHPFPTWPGGCLCTGTIAVSASCLAIAFLMDVLQARPVAVRVKAARLSHAYTLRPLRGWAGECIAASAKRTRLLSKKALP